MLRTIIAHSDNIETSLVLEDLLAQCHHQLGDLKPGAAILFSALQIDEAVLLQGLSEAFPGLPLIGCTTDGEFSSQGGFLEDSVSLTLFVSDTISFSSGLGRQVSQDHEKACQQALSEAGYIRGDQTKLCVTTPESLTTSGQQLLNVFKVELGNDVPVVGGVSADYWQFKGTRQFYDTDVVSDSLPILLFSGPLVVSFGVASGWEPIGEPGIVTRATGPLVHEINNQPAINYYRRFLGKHAQPTGDRPLVLLDDDNRIVGLRAPPGIVDEEGGVSFFADVSEGSRVQLTVTNRDDIIKGSRTSIQEAIVNYPKGLTPEAGLFFSCSGRKYILGSRVTEEESIIREELPGIPFTGFYGYGEIGPPIHGENKGAQFHNETFVSVLLGTTDASTTPDQEEIPSIASEAEQLPSDKELKQRIAILEARLSRSETHRLLLEQNKDQTDSLYKNVIQELEESNQVILSSIRYASHIQHSILPLEHNMKNALSSYFVTWEPRDVVGGDMYWCRPWGDGYIVILGDCTGHGVPGAFMTLISNGALNQASREVEPGKPGLLLQRIHQLIQSALGQHLAEGASDDGLELGICYIPTQSDTMIFSGARFELFILENDEISGVKGTKKGTGYRGIPKDQEYSEIVIELRHGQRFYMTSDGIIDQVGGEKRRGFGKRKFKALLQESRDLSFEKQKDLLLQALGDHQGSENRRDDVSIIGFSLDQEDSIS
jgi:serine phosphatase RsbU (regulator of sigma subunit)